MSVGILSTEECQKEIDEGFALLNANVDEGNLCTSAQNGISTCFGDSGSPVVVRRDDNKYSLVGIVSWVIGCGEYGNPDVHTNVSSYIPFISAAIANSQGTYLDTNYPVLLNYYRKITTGSPLNEGLGLDTQIILLM